MNKLRAQLTQLRVVQYCASVKIAVVCLSLLFVLTFWGTVAQVESGLYLAQERYFYSLVFPVFGFIPFPGARLVLWILFVNLVCAALVHFQYRWRNIGILIIHIGLLSFFVSAFVTFHWAEESQLTLLEGAASNVSSAYQSWEVSVWKDTGDEDEPSKNVFAYDADDLRAGQVLDFANLGFTLTVKLYHPNAEAYTSDADFSSNVVMNRSGIRILKEIPRLNEMARNVPGGIFLVQGQSVLGANILLYGGEQNPTQFKIANETYNFLLRRKRFALPFVLKLDDFMMEVHPNTEIAKSYQSRVEITSHDVSREVEISMNKPLRYKDYTFYQASYSIDAMGREYSTLAVVKNAGRLMPYIASSVTVIGLIVHFLMAGLISRKGKKIGIAR